MIKSGWAYVIIIFLTEMSVQVKEEMESWLYENLAPILNFTVCDDIIQFILRIENERDLEAFLKDYTDVTNAKYKQFKADFKKRQALSKDQVKYKKINETSNDSRKQTDKKKGKVKGKESKENKQIQDFAKTEKVEKKKTKFVNLYSEEGKDGATILLKGRHKCDCEAKRHALINNCLNCGRIVCTQEGAGPCFFCGEVVCTLKEQYILSGNTKQADQLYNKLKNQKVNKNWEEAINHRDKLLEYDRDGVQCTKVIDDECDYYQSNNMWLTSKHREKLQKQEEEIHQRKHMSRLNKKSSVTFDFAGREVFEENPIDDFTELNEEEFLSIPEICSEIESSNVCPNVEFNQPMYIETNDYAIEGAKTSRFLKQKNIIQDKEYLEMSDAGLCLSMHQPYASLLVAGIKVHEGRSWYSSHRGRLWIAAASKVPSKEEISDIEHFYRELKNEKLIFPESYPTSCLLGCVTVVDVLPQEEYRKSYPNGENDSPYVFICDHFYTLPIKLPIQGKHKIYKLDQKIHHTAVKLLEKSFKKCK